MPQSPTLKVPFYTAVTAFVILMITAVVWQQLALLAIPVTVLLALWAFQKPVVLFYALIAAIPWSVEYNFGTLGTDLPDEPLMLLCSCAVFFWMAYYYKKYQQKFTLHPLLFLLLLQFAWAAITVATSTDFVVSIKYLAAKSWYLLAFVALPVLVFKQKKEIKNTVLLLVVSMAAVVVLTVVRHAQSGFTFATINKSLAPFFRNHVNYSALEVCTIPLLFALYAFAEKKWVKTVLIFLILIFLAALYFSYARGAWLALFTGAFAYLLLKKRLLVYAFVLTVLLVTAGVFYLRANDNYLRFSNNHNTTIFHTDFREHLIATYELKDVSTAERFYRWVAGVAMVKDSWKTGFGPSTFYNNYQHYTYPSFKTWVSKNEEHSTVHNYFLLLLIEQGVMGLLLFLILIVYVLHTAQHVYHHAKDRFWKVVSATVAVIIAMVCTVNFLSDLVETDKVGSIFYTCIAIIIIADNKLKSSDLSTNI